MIDIFEVEEIEYYFSTTDNNNACILRKDGIPVSNQKTVLKKALEKYGNSDDIPPELTTHQLITKLKLTLAAYSEDEKNIQCLQEFLEDIDCLDDLSNYTNQVNFFAITGIPNFEIRHSKFLAWLLNPNESHGLGDFFLKKFLQKLIKNSWIKNGDYQKSRQSSVLTIFDVDSMDFDDFEVHTEDNNIDILIRSHKEEFVLAIENKYHSKEHDNQLRTYKNFIDNNYPENFRKMFAFLTLDGHEPESESDSKWGQISYADIISILEKSLQNKEIKSKTKTILTDYSDVLKRELKMDLSLQEICRKIYQKHGKAIDLIIENKPDDFAEIHDSYEKILKEYASKGSIILIKSTSAYLHFTTPAIRRVFQNMGTNEWLGESDMLAYEIQFSRNYGKIHFGLIIGPGKKENRDACFDFFKNNFETSRRVRNTGTFSTFFGDNMVTVKEDSSGEKKPLDIEKANKTFDDKIAKIVFEVDKIIYQKYQIPLKLFC